MTEITDIYLDRKPDGEKETLGTIYFNGNYVLNTFDSLELPWKGNKPFVSCIPPGDYPFEKWYSEKFDRTVLRIKDVPDRDDVLMHPANYVRQLEGCIAPGLTLADIDQDGLMDVSKSILALEAILSLVADQGIIHIS